MQQSEKYRLAKRMRLAARIIGLGVVGFGAFFWIGEGIITIRTEGWKAVDIAGVLICVIGAVALAGCILSWWRERAAGIMLVSSAVAMGVVLGVNMVLGCAAMGIHIGVSEVGGLMLAWSRYGLLFLVAGVLFLNSWWISRELR